MDNTFGLEVLTKNQDLFRGSVQSLDNQAIARALQWLRGEAEYPYPVSVHLNLTLRCTARCSHCTQWTWPSHSEYSLTQIERLFEVFKTWGVKTITLGGGNPLLHKHVAVVLQMARDADIAVSIVSEGIEMSDELADAICQYARWIRFSVDGPSAAVHDKIRGAPGLFDLVMSDVSILRSRHSSLLIGLNCVMQKGNIDTLSQMIDLAEQIHVDAMLFKIPHGEDYGGRFLPSVEEWERFVTWVKTTSTKEIRVRTNLRHLADLLGPVFRTEDAVIGKPVKNFYSEMKARCFVPFFFLVCDSEGNIYPCDYLQADTRQWGGKYSEMRQEFRVGNILEDSQGAIDNLANMMRHRIHNLPGGGYDECGCCTRFCQLNAALTKIDGDLGTDAIDMKSLNEHLREIEADDSGIAFL